MTFHSKFLFLSTKSTITKYNTIVVQVATTPTTSAYDYLKLLHYLKVISVKFASTKVMLLDAISFYTTATVNLKAKLRV